MRKQPSTSRSPRGELSPRAVSAIEFLDFIKFPGGLDTNSVPSKVQAERALAFLRLYSFPGPEGRNPQVFVRLRSISPREIQAALTAVMGFLNSASVDGGIISLADLGALESSVWEQYSERNPGARATRMPEGSDAICPSTIDFYLKIAGAPSLVPGVESTASGVERVLNSD